MKIPLKILIGNIPSSGALRNWDEIIDEWQEYSALWNLNSTIEAPVLDMFSDEGISIKSIVKDMSDPKKLFTDYSRSFTVPASKKNNRIFKHYYNIDITNGLDSRELVPASLLMNNATYKVGNIRVEGVKMSRGVAQSYKITFIGMLSELSRQMGAARLTSLDFSAYDKSTFDVKSEVTNTTLRPVVFPLSSRSPRYLYDPSQFDLGIENSRNIAYSGNVPQPNYGIREGDIVGAMAVGTILDTIESKYGFNFTGALTAPYVRDLYLWLHQTDSERIGENFNAAVGSLAWVGSSNSDFTRNDASLIYNGTSGTPYTEGHLRYVIYFKGTWTGDAKVKMLHNGAEVATVDTSNTYGGFLTIDNSNVTDAYTFVVESNTSMTIPVDIYLEVQEYQVEEQYIGEGYMEIRTDQLSGSGNIGSSGTYFVAKNLPKMTIMDFLSSLFKMFNIVAEVDSDLNISTKHFDHFMSEGVVKDVTEYTYTDEYDVNRANTYSSMQMEFSDSKTALELGYLAVNAKEYGELAYELSGNTGARLSGSVYNLKIDNQRIPVEPLTNLNTNNLTNIAYTLFSDLKGAEQGIDPSFTYVCGQDSVTDTITFYDPVEPTEENSYMTPCNTYNPSADVPNKNINALGLYFGEELNEYNTASTMYGIGLWNNFYRGITSMMFDDDKRRVKFNAELPQGVVLNLSLADTLKINNNFYNINSIETNYLSGVSKMDLTLVGRSQLSHFQTGSVRITNNSATETLYITFMDSTIGRIVSGVQISPLGVFTNAMIGTVVGRSHPDLTVEIL